MRKSIGIAALSLGLVLVVAAALVNWVVAPRLAMLPGDTSVLRVYAGNAAVMFNPTSTTGTTIGPGIMRDVPVTLLHRTHVVRTSGSDALVSDERSVHIPGFTVADLTYLFGVDRKTMGPVDTFTDAPAHQGLTFNWPMSTQRHDYVGWVADTQSTTNLRYVGEARRGGVDTYVFTTTVATTPIRDLQLLKLLPAAMTKQQILELTPSLQLTHAQLLQNAKLLNRLPDPAPMTYTYRLQATYWVAPATGVVVDTVHHEVRTANFVDGAKVIPATPIMDMTYQATPATLAGAATDARDGAAKLRLINTTLPLVALISGLLLALLGAVLLLIGRRPSTGTPPSPPVEEVDVHELVVAAQ